MRKGIVLSAIAMLVACGGAPDGEGPQTTVAAPDAETPQTKSDTDQQLRTEIETRFNAYVRALVDDDAQALEALVSNEIKQRATEMGSDLHGFRNKMFRSMEREFGAVTASPAEPLFTVTDVQLEGNAAEVYVERQGAALPKPFYFVLEGDQYRLNLLPAGFSKPLPAGAGAGRDYDNYLIQNEWPYTAGVGDTLWCNWGGDPFFVPTGMSVTHSCSNNCGWWHGATFRRPGSSIERICDYNTWGVDVKIGPFYLDGWDCNDYC